MRKWGLPRFTAILPEALMGSAEIECCATIPIG